MNYTDYLPEAKRDSDGYFYKNDQLLHTRTIGWRTGTTHFSRDLYAWMKEDREHWDAFEEAIFQAWSSPRGHEPTSTHNTSAGFTFKVRIEYSGSPRKAVAGGDGLLTRTTWIERVTN